MGRVAIITGAARGLGLACAEQFARDGYDLALLDADAAGLAACIRGDRGPWGSKVAAITVDIRDRAGCAAAVVSAVERFDGLDVLVNAAGVYPRRPVLDISADDWQFVFGSTCLGRTS